SVSAEDLERYETEIELQLYKEYRDVLPMFSYVVETERRFYLANDVKMEVRNEGGRVYFDVHLHDAWVWDMYRPARFVSDVHVVAFKDVNVEELAGKEIWCRLPAAARRSTGGGWISAPGVRSSPPTGTRAGATPCSAGTGAAGRVSSTSSSPG